MREITIGKQRSLAPCVIEAEIIVLNSVLLHVHQLSLTTTDIAILRTCQCKRRRTRLDPIDTTISPRTTEAQYIFIGLLNRRFTVNLAANIATLTFCSRFQTVSYFQSTHLRNVIIPDVIEL